MTTPNKSKRASKDELDALHAQVAKTLHGALTQTWTDKETGEVTPPPAALINVAVNFLKANGITGAAVQAGSPLDFLKEASLPFFEETIREVAGSRH